MESFICSDTNTVSVWFEMLFDYLWGFMKVVVFLRLLFRQMASWRCIKCFFPISYSFLFFFPRYISQIFTSFRHHSMIRWMFKKRKKKSRLLFQSVPGAFESPERTAVFEISENSAYILWLSQFANCWRKFSTESRVSQRNNHTHGSLPNCFPSKFWWIGFTYILDITLDQRAKDEPSTTKPRKIESRSSHNSIQPKERISILLSIRDSLPHTYRAQ